MVARGAFVASLLAIAIGAVLVAVAVPADGAWGRSRSRSEQRDVRELASRSAGVAAQPVASGFTAPIASAAPVAEEMAPFPLHRQWELGAKYTYRIVTIGQGDPSAGTLHGELQMVVAAHDGELITLYVQYAGSDAESDDGAGQPFLATYHQSGRLVGIYFDRATPAPARGVLSRAVTALQWVTPKEPDAERWTATEGDGREIYEAGYRRDADHSRRVEKSNPIAGKAGVADWLTDATFLLNDEGWPELVRADLSRSGEDNSAAEMVVRVTAALIARTRDLRAIEQAAALRERVIKK